MPLTLSPASPAALEALSDALDRAVRIDADTDTRAWIKADNRLLDACVDAGMAYDDADHRGWAAERVATWLSSGVECDCGATTNNAEPICGMCLAEYRAERADMAEAW